MHPSFQVLGLTSRIGWHIAKERLTDPHPTRLSAVPPTTDHITDEWLTLALCDGVSAAEVISHELGPRDDGTSARRTLRVFYNDAGQEARLPEHLFTKSGPTFRTRLLSAAAALGQIESAFYALIRPSLEIEAPVTRYSAFDPISNRQMLLVDDVSITRGATFGSVLTRTLTRGQAEQVVDLLAALHARFWNARLGNLYGAWLPDACEWADRLSVTTNAPRRVVVGMERGKEVIPPALYERRETVHGAMMRTLEMHRDDPQTILHGDVHPGNWYLTEDGRMGLHDWQCMVRGNWARDLAYALSSHLTVEQRREWEHKLVARYVEGLANDGLTAPDHESAFLSYRQHMTHAMYMWLGTLGRHRLQPDMQPADIALESVRRTCQAAADLDTLGAVEQGWPT